MSTAEAVRRRDLPLEEMIFGPGSGVRPGGTSQAVAELDELVQKLAHGVAQLLVEALQAWQSQAARDNQNLASQLQQHSKRLETVADGLANLHTRTDTLQASLARHQTAIEDQGTRLEEISRATTERVNALTGRVERQEAALRFLEDSRSRREAAYEQLAQILLQMKSAEGGAPGQ